MPAYCPSKKKTFQEARILFATLLSTLHVTLFTIYYVLHWIYGFRKMVIMIDGYAKGKVTFVVLVYVSNFK